jgi:hypothetical protein
MQVLSLINLSARVVRAELRPANRIHVDIWRNAWSTIQPLAFTPTFDLELFLVQYPDIVEIVELISEELGSLDQITLDVDNWELGLRPATSLPDPAVDRYLPLEEKLMQAIYSFKSMTLDPYPRSWIWNPLRASHHPETALGGVEPERRN